MYIVYGVDHYVPCQWGIRIYEHYHCIVGRGPVSGVLRIALRVSGLGGRGDKLLAHCVNIMVNLPSKGKWEYNVLAGE